LEKPLTILILDNTFTFGGATKSLCNLLRALNRDQFEPVLVTGQTKYFLAEHFDCTCYHYVPKLTWVNNFFYKKIANFKIFRYRFLMKQLNFFRFLYWLFFVTFPEALKYLYLGRKHHVCLVHLNNIMGSQLAGILAAKLLRVPCVAHLRDFEEVHPITRFYARLIDHHVAISNAIRENLLQLGVNEDRITVVYDAIEPSDFQVYTNNDYLVKEFSLCREQPTFGIFGRVVEWKGIREFIYVVKKVVIDFPTVRAFVVGGFSDGDESFFHSMQQLASDLDIEENVVFTGYRGDVPSLMGLMDVIVHASIRPEPFGMVIIEGMAMKKPIVATKAGGPLDIIIEGKTGFLVEMGDIEAMGRAIITLLHQHNLRQEMGQAGSERVIQQFTNRRYAIQMAEIYQSLSEKA
jgi:glycosyltransferase involved in cell wall biosynthesis